MQLPAPPQLALVLTFDAQTQARLEQVISQLESQGLTPFPEGMRVSPHVTLHAFTFPSVDKSTQGNVAQPNALPLHFFESLTDLAHRLAPIEINLESLGAFNSEQGVIFLAPVATRSLQSIHFQAQQLLARYDAMLHPYYLPDQWVPHVTIAVEQPPEALPVVFRTCQDMQAFLTGRAENLLLVDYPPPRRLAAVRLGGGEAPETNQAAL